MFNYCLAELFARVGMGPMTKQFVTKQADTALEWLEHGVLWGFGFLPSEIMSLSPR
jgi:hypothetical protein